MYSKALIMSIFFWLLGSIFYAYQYVFRVLPNLIVADIMDIFHVTSDHIGSLGGIYYIGYSLVLIPIGILADRFSAKRVLPACILLCVCGNLPLILGDSWSMTLIGRLFVGIGSAGAPIGLFKIISMHFNDKHFSKLLGISVSIGLIGAVFGSEPLAHLFSIYGWQVVIKAFMYFGFVLALVTYIFLPKDKEIIEETSILEDIKQVLTSKKVIALSIMGGLMLGPLEGFADVWGKEFFQTVYNMDGNLAARLPSLIFLGMCLGCSVIGYVAQKTGAYYGIMITAAAIMAGCFIWVLSGQCPCALMYLIFSVVGILSAYQIILIYKTTTYMPVRMTGLTAAVCNSFIMLFGFAFHKVIGKVMLIYSVELNDTINYPAEAFIKALAIIPAALIVALVGLVILRQIDRRNLNEMIS